MQIRSQTLPNQEAKKIYELFVEKENNLEQGLLG
jgi:hypothetical protein